MLRAPRVPLLELAGSHASLDDLEAILTDAHSSLATPLEMQPGWSGSACRSSGPSTGVAAADDAGWRLAPWGTCKSAAAPPAPHGGQVHC